MKTTFKDLPIGTIFYFVGEPNVTVFVKVSWFLYATVSNKDECMRCHDIHKPVNPVVQK